MAKHIHIHFAPRKRIGDQAPGSVPPSDLKPLVEALHAAIAAREGATPTKDADFDESKIKRDEGGRFSAQQHMEAAAKHHSDADTHKAAGNAPAAKAHTEAAMEHEMAAQHINAKTGWAAHRSQSAHNKSAEAAKLSANTPTSLDQLKAQASDPNASIEQRAAAVSQLSKMEKMANEVASSPHAIPKSQSALEQALAGPRPDAPRPNPAGPGNGKWGAGMKVHPDDAQTGKPVPQPGQPGYAAYKAAMSPPRGTYTGEDPKVKANPTTQAPAAASTPQAPQPAGKPTSAKASGAKAATHELLSSGHPFSVDELMKATNCSNRTTLMTALSDLKSPKYAGKLGALNIVKRPDGMYHVQKDDGKPLGKAAADKPASGTRTRAELDAEMAPGAPGRIKPGGKHDMVTMANEQTDAYVKGGGGPLPMVNTEGGGSRNPVQNVQARMDAKAATKAPGGPDAGPTKGSTLGPDMPGKTIPKPPPTASPAAPSPTSTYSPDQAVKDLHGKQFGPIQVSARVHSQTGELMANWDHTFRRNTRVGEYKEQQQHIDRANAHLAGVAKKLGATYKPYTIEDAKRSDERAQQNEGSAYSEYEQSMGSGFKHAKAGAPAPSPAAPATSPTPSPQSTSSSTFWKNAYKKLGQNSRR